MTKREIRVELEESDWINSLDGFTVRRAIEWLQDYDPECVLDSYRGYEECTGIVVIERPETNEEYAERLDKEAAAEALRIKQNEQVKISTAEREAKLLQSKVAQDVAIWAYLQKHKDNPHKADLDNLYRAMIQLERDGHNPNGAAMRGIKECMESLELLG